MSEDKTGPVEYILVAEDSPPNRRILAHTLARLGFLVVESANGEEAWSKMNNPELGVVIGVFSDVMMPTMDGFELLTKVRAEKKWETLPFVLVSAVSEKKKVLEAREHNVAGYLVKPIQFQKILELVTKIYPSMTFDAGAIPRFR